MIDQQAIRRERALIERRQLVSYEGSRPVPAGQCHSDSHGAASMVGGLIWVGFPP